MKTPKLLLNLMALVSIGFTAELHAQSSAFTYQGSLSDNGSPASGIYDLRFALYNAASAGAQQGSTITNTATAVSNGLFTVTLDFGNQFPGADRWLEIGVVTNGSGAFSTLTPRQPITSTPYAIQARAAANAETLTGTLPAEQLSGTINPTNIGNGSISAAMLATGAVGSTQIANGSVAAIDLNLADFNTTFWRPAGNAGTAGGTHFLGTTDNQPLQLRVNNQHALRLEYPTVGTVPNLIGGSSANSVGAGTEGAVIAGGFDNDIGEDSIRSAIGGGWDNNIAANSPGSTIAGGILNDIGEDSTRSAIGGGWNNNIASNSWDATIAGGYLNYIGVNSDYSAIGGGNDNHIADNAPYAVIPGGRANRVGPGASYAFAAGRRAQANHSGTFVWADSQGPDFISTGTNQFLIRASGGVGIGEGSPLAALHVQNPAVGSDLGVNAVMTGPDEDVVVEDQDAGLGLYSGAGGNYGSLLTFKEVVGNSLINTWGIVRRTTGSAAELQFRFGPDPSAALNPYKMGIATNGTVTATVFSPTSDRNAKENFAMIDPASVLEKVAALPISQWNFKTDSGTPHIGPMAQDFYAAFGLGLDDKHIATVDADGVALAAIQGLNQKVEVGSRRSEDRIEKLESENAELKTRLEKIEQLMNEKLAAGGAK